MAVFDKARELSFKATADRIDKVATRQGDQRRINNLVSVTGYNTATGMVSGAYPDGSIIEFELETNSVAPIGTQIEVAIARGSSYGRADSKPSGL